MQILPPLYSFTAHRVHLTLLHPTEACSAGSLQHQESSEQLQHIHLSLVVVYSLPLASEHEPWHPLPGTTCRLLTPRLCRTL